MHLLGIDSETMNATEFYENEVSYFIMSKSTIICFLKLVLQKVVFKKQRK